MADKILGIDLGTTNSVMAFIDEETPTVIPNAEGQNKTPSVVSFLPTGGTVVGEIARRQAATNVEGTIFSVKRLIGRASTDDVGDELDFFTCPVAERGGQVGLEVGGEIRSPAEISALILGKLKKDAEEFFGEEISRAVITVPAYFDDRQRQATIDAGRLAGLEVLRIINEPTAAAMAYGLGRQAEERIAVFDFGGGTFDLSILDISRGAFEVVTSLGDSRLGGDDIDIAIVDMILEEYHENHGIDLGTDDLAIRRLKEAAEKAKCELSGTQSTMISLPFIAQAQDGSPLHLEMPLTREQLEALLDPLVERCLGVCKQALNDASLATRDITKVILVGGSTRIPIVQEAVEDFFGLTPHRGVNPDEIVAMGAATQGGVMSGALQEVVLLEVTPFALGIETKGDKVSRVIEKNTTVPIKAAKVFTTTEDEQALVNIHVVQGEAERASEGVSLGKFTLADVPEAPAGQPRIRVTFHINADGMVEIEAAELGSGLSQTLRILHTFDESVGAQVIGGEEGDTGTGTRHRRPNRWRDRRRRAGGAAPARVAAVPAAHGGDAPNWAAAPEEGQQAGSGEPEVAPEEVLVRSGAATHVWDTDPQATPAPEGDTGRRVETAREYMERRADDTVAQAAYRSAISALQRHVEEDDIDAETLRLLGELHLLTHNAAEARTCFQQHMKGHPDQLSELRGCYDRFVEIFPQTTEARVDRAKFLAALGEVMPAIEDLESISGPEGRSPAVVEQLIQLLRRQLEENADPAMEFKLVKLHLQQNDLDEAISILQRLVNNSSYTERAGKILGLCFWQKHMHYLAWQRFRQLPLSDEIKDILYRLSLDMESSEDLEGARQVLEHLLEAGETYRDVGERLERVRERLREARPRSSPSASDSPNFAASPESQIDDVRFSIVGEINRGSMGVIYKAKDNVLDEIVAIKVLNAFLCADPQAVERFKREARAAKRLSHPSIVRIHDMFEKGNKKFLSMEFIDGADLKSILKTMGTMDPLEIIRVVGEICQALAYAHRLDVIHRDIKPANIMIAQRTRGIKVTDFGIAKCLDAGDRSGTGTMVMGTPLYMAPEQVEGRPVDRRTDLYSLGVLMYELVSGKPPFTEGNIEYHHVNSEPEPPGNCPESLSEVIMRCLKKDAADRFQSADELLAQLKGLALAGAQAGTEPEPDDQASDPS